MSLENLILPDILIAELYKNVFVVNDGIPSQKREEAVTGPAADKIKFLGNNLKKIAIVVNHSSDVFLPERHLEFLTKILVACKLNIGDVAIVNEGYKFVDIQTLKQQLKCNYIILFGIDLTEIKLPLNFPYFKIQTYADSTYLSVPSLDQLNNDIEEGKLLKTKLWTCLKTLFDVSSTI
ncbi:MAG: hypothetical protein H7122_03230 [Chitinophagaceae bacterium]|nr:hypothetical protein [Chitinophagaceae bacterium]